MKKFFGLLLSMLLLAFGSFGTEVKAAPTEMSVMGFMDTGPTVEMSINQEIVCADSIYLVDNLSVLSDTSSLHSVNNGTLYLGSTKSQAMICESVSEVEVVILCYTLSLRGHSTLDTDTRLKLKVTDYLKVDGTPIRNS